MPKKSNSLQALHFDGVSHRYGRARSVEDISFSVNAGETVCLLGPSGCGKTTLLRLASGLEAPESGRISIAGATVASGKRITPPEKRPISMVFQDYALFPHLNVLQNVVFGLKRVQPEERYRRARDVLGKVGLSHVEKRFPHTLSGGQQQRVALARAIALRPAVMLMDEPFSNLDINLRFSVREETRKILRAEGAATVLVTHDGEEASQLADRILLLNQGSVMQEGTPEAFYFYPRNAFAARFFGETETTRGSVCEGTLDCPLGQWNLPGKTVNGPVEVIVRNQAFLFHPPAEDRQHYRQTEVRIVESRVMGGRRVTELAIGGDHRFRAIHRMTTHLSPGETHPCWVDTRLVFPFSSPIKTGLS